MNSADESITVRGGCHCGAVRFEAVLPRRIVAQECNCSICAMVGFEHLICPKSAFRLLQGEDVLTDYRFNTGVARHLFCSICGVKPMYVPRSNPDGWSINARCLDPGHGLEIQREAFDGQNWEDNAERLAHLSADD